ncbi:MAG: glutamate 5-kinase [Oscillatoriales cyanobacterium SM2_2_1]|nr:glutamate 5-kinase [Oscillatoriales cyanobacterium SM2_2_1]
MGEPQTIVIKIGTSSLTRPDTGDLCIAAIARLVEVAVGLRRRGYHLVLVSSGAVGVGCARLGFSERPQKLSLKQAIAAVGQGRLMRIYDDFFAALHQPVAQVLLTRASLIQRQQYRNICDTFRELLHLGVIPIVNENDTVAIEELKFGDNDTLSALVASLIEAQWLFLLTDVERLYSADPRLDPQAQAIDYVEMPLLEQLIAEHCDRPTTKSQWGTGGMVTKLTAARIAASAGVRTVISSGQMPERIPEILAGQPYGTQFAPQAQTLSARKRWLAFGLLPSGSLTIDDGAVLALTQKGRSLLAAGIVAVRGTFDSQELVSICDQQGRELGRGMVNFSADEVSQICGCQSEAIAQLLNLNPEDIPETVIHRDNLVIL